MSEPDNSELIQALYQIGEQIGDGGVVTDSTDADLIWYEITTPLRVIEVVLWGDGSAPFHIWERPIGSSWTTGLTRELAQHFSVERTVLSLRKFIEEDGNAHPRR